MKDNPRPLDRELRAGMLESLENGLLHVELVREIPEAQKPHQIAIDGKVNKPKVVDAKAA